MNGQRIIGITFIAVVMLVAIVLLIQAGRYVIGGSNDGDKTKTEQVEKSTISNYIDSKARALFIDDGEIINKETHNRIEIEVTPSKREIRIINGYNDKVVTRKTFKNDAQSYAAFMHALSFEGILLTQEAAYPMADGVCPTGERYTFELDVDGTDEDVSTWASSCSKKHGSFAGDRRGVQDLFKKQIPEYRELTRSIQL